MNVDIIRSVFTQKCQVIDCSCLGGNATIRVTHNGHSWNVCEDGGNMVAREIALQKYEDAILEKM